MGAEGVGAEGMGQAGDGCAWRFVRGSRRLDHWLWRGEGGQVTPGWCPLGHRDPWGLEDGDGK